MRASCSDLLVISYIYIFFQGGEELGFGLGFSMSDKYGLSGRCPWAFKWQSHDLSIACTEAGGQTLLDSQTESPFQKFVDQSRALTVFTLSAHI